MNPYSISKYMEMIKNTVACVLFTGGMDSTAVVLDCKERGYYTVALTLKQGNDNWKELEIAGKLAKKIGIEHHIYDISTYSQFISKTVTNSCGYQEGNEHDIETNFIYNRNAMFTLIGHSLVQMIMKQKGFEYGMVMLGMLSLDPEYPDCSEKYFKNLSKALQPGLLNGKVTVELPIFNWNKKRVFKFLKHHKITLDETWSCNTNNDKPCGECFGCTQLKKIGKF